jgi:hypothetical protein
VDEFEHLAVLGRQAGQGVAHRQRDDDPVGVVALLRVGGGDVPHLLRAHRAGPGRVGHEVAHDGQQPAAHRTPAVDEGVGVAPGADERLLHEVLGGGVVAGQLEGVAAHGVPVFAHDVGDEAGTALVGCGRPGEGARRGGHGNSSGIGGLRAVAVGNRSGADPGAGDGAGPATAG